MKFFSFLTPIFANEVYDNFLAIKNEGQAARAEWSGSCKDRAQWRNLFGDEENGYLDAGFHVCQTDTELYYDAYDPDGTSVFTIEKINEWVSLWPGLGNHLIFGSPEFKCGCFLGCDRFFVEGIGLHVDFCCSDYEETCVNPPNVSDALEQAKTAAEEKLRARKADGYIFTDLAVKKLRRFVTKLKRNIKNDEPDCKVRSGCKAGETPLTHGCRRKSNPAFGTPWNGNEEQSLVDPFRKRRSRDFENIVEPSKNGKFSSHKIADDLWHVVDHYFKDCLNVRKHLNKVNKLTNTLDKVKKR